MASEANFRLGSRVQVIAKEGDVKIGTVAFIGATQFASGKWIGVVLDEPKGKNNGEVQGHKYFTCPDGYGIFVRPTQIQLVDGDPLQLSSLTDSSGRPSSRPLTPTNVSEDPMSSSVQSDDAVPPAADQALAAASLQQTPAVKRTMGLRPPSSVSRAPAAGAGGAQTPAATAAAAAGGSGAATPRAPAGLSKLPASSGGSRGSLTSIAGGGLSATGRAGSSSSIASLGSAGGRAGSSQGLPATAGGRAESIREDRAQAEAPAPAQLKAATVAAMPAAASAPPPATTPTSLTAPMTALLADHLASEEKLHGEIKDLQEKLETLKIKRLEDKNKLKELEKARIQLEHLQEYKLKTQESHRELQQQLVQARKEAKEHLDALERYKEDMAETAETVELATLDKEMAEEKAETLQQECESLRQTVDELKGKIEHLESAAATGPAAASAHSSVMSTPEVKQLVDSNEKLKEALVKIRDVANAKTHEVQNLKKQLDKTSNELSSTTRDKDRLTQELATLNAEMIELKDQVDAASGTAEMVEKLTDRNLELEERIQALENEKADLEAINEMNEELQESARETEFELREQLDMARSQVAQFEKRVETLQLQASDYQATVLKFRELVQQLHEENAKIKSGLSAEKEASVAMPSTPVLAFDFSSRFHEVKAQAKVIEAELLQLELKECKDCLQLTGLFLTDAFFRHGGDYDGIQAVLLIPSLLGKSEVLSNYATAKLPSIGSDEHKLVSIKSEQYSFIRNMLCNLAALDTYLLQLQSSAKAGNVEIFKKLASSLSDMRMHSRSVAKLLDLLQKDQLDETVSLKPLIEAVQYFKGLLSACCYMESDATQSLDCSEYMRSHARVLQMQVDALHYDLGQLLAMMGVNGDSASPMCDCLRALLLKGAELASIAKQMKHRLKKATDGSALDVQVTYKRETKNSLDVAATQAGSLVSVLRETTANAARAMHLLTDSKVLSTASVEKLLAAAAGSHLNTAGDVYQQLQHCLDNPISTLKPVAISLDNGDFDVRGAKQSDKLATNVVQLRAQAFKAEAADSEAVKHKLQTKDEIVADLMLQLKTKHEELQELQVRGNMSERRLESTAKEKDDQIAKLQRKLDEASILIVKKEKEFEKTMDALQADIDSLEHEKTELKARLNTLSKKQLIEGLSRQTSGAGTGLISASGLDSPLLLEQIKALKSALHHAQKDTFALRAEAMKAQLKTLRPLKVPPLGLTALGIGKRTFDVAQLEQLKKDVAEIKNEVSASTVLCKQLIDIRKPQESQLLSLADEECRSLLLAGRLHKLKQHVSTFVVSSSAGGQAGSDMQSFPTPQYLRVMPLCSEGGLHQPKLIGRVRVPVANNGSSEVVPVNVTAVQLSQLHLSVLS